MPNIRSVGLPRSLMYYRYGDMWRTFFEELGIDVVVSPSTDRALLEAGDAVSIDECCLASKVFMGHVGSLIGDVDAIFVPAIASGNVRSGFCTKYQSLPDMVRNTFRDKLSATGTQILSTFIEDVTKGKRLREEYQDLATSLGASPHLASKAYKRAMKAQRKANDLRAKAQAESLELIGQYKSVAAEDPAGTEHQQVPIPILVIGHPYVTHDEFVAGDVIRSIEEAGGFVLYADETDHERAMKRSFEFSETLPWELNRELVGALLELNDQVAGVVIISAFPCGPDSLFADALVRDIDDMPILRLVIDAQSGSAGVQTRVESFMDILTYQAKGGYLNA